MSVGRDTEAEEDYILVANPPGEDYDDGITGSNSFTDLYDAKIKPMSGGRGNYLMEIEEHWPNTDDVLAVNAEVLRPFIDEGNVAKVSRNIPVWVKYEGGETNTVLDFPREFQEDPMEYDIIIGSKPSAGPGIQESQNQERAELEGEDVRVSNIKSGSKPVIQGQAPMQQVHRQLDPESPERQKLEEFLEKDPEEIGR
jgi:hypothetical protein